jgi:hypothetical protein
MREAGFAILAHGSTAGRQGVADGGAASRRRNARRQAACPSSIPDPIPNRSTTQAHPEDSHLSRSRIKPFASALCGAFVVALSAGCSSDDVISHAEAKETHRPGMFETKDIAEEGFIYGLPIVMNYAVMYEYAVDRGLRSPSCSGAARLDACRLMCPDVADRSRISVNRAAATAWEGGRSARRTGTPPA